MAQRFRNLVELGEHSCGTFADRQLFGTRTPNGYVWTTYRAFQRLVDDLRGGLASLGVQAGDKVAIVANNRVEWAVAAYATYGLGATFVPMYEAQRPDEWQFILGDCGAKVVFGSKGPIVAMLEGMRPNLPGLAHVIGIERGEGAESYLSLLDRGRKMPTPSVSPEPSAVAGFVYTSGTTGKPKGVMLTHDNFTSNIHAGLSVFPVSPDDVTLSFLPWAHVYGQAIELHLVISAGASTAFVSDLSKLVDELADVRPTMLVAVPRIFNRIYAGVTQQIASKPKFVRSLVQTALRAAARKRKGEPVSPLGAVALRLADPLVFAKVRAKFGGRLRYAISASAALSLEVAEFIDALGIPVYEGYGLTETSPIVSGNYPGARKLGSVGKPMPGVTVTIDRSVTDEPEGGEIVVHGPNVMRGYHNRPDENAKALLPDGGFRTGDLGYVDDDGYVHITGRIKEQYKLENGKYVQPSSLEESLKLSPYVLNVMLYGDNKPFNVAVVVLDAAAIKKWASAAGVTLGPDLTTDPSVLRLIRAEMDRCGEAFRKFERPTAFVLTLEDFTIESGLLTPTLKLKRGAVVARYRDRIEALYASRPPAEGVRAPEPAASAGPPR